MNFKKDILLLAALVLPLFLSSKQPETDKSHSKLIMEWIQTLVKNGDEASCEKLKKMEQNGLDLKKTYQIEAPNCGKVPASLLVSAVACGRSEQTVKYLVERGADVNTVVQYNGESMTPLAAALHKSAQRDCKSKFSVEKYLISKGADVNLKITKTYKKKPFQEAPLALALYACVEQGNYDLPFLQLLLEKGADPKVKTCLRRKDIAKQQSLYALIGRNGEGFALTLVQKGVDGVPSKYYLDFLRKKPAPNQKKLDSALDGAIYSDLDSILGNVKILLEAGANPNRSNFLESLAKQGNIPVLEYLHTHGVDYKKGGRFAIFGVSDPKTARYLHSRGASLNVVRADNPPSLDRRTPLSCAVDKENFEVIEYLLNNGVSVNSEGVADSAVRLIRFGSAKTKTKILSLLLARGLSFSEAQKKSIAEKQESLDFARKIGIKI